MEVRGRRGRAAAEEEEGVRRRRTPVAPVAVFASGWRGRERWRERERGGKTLEEVEAVVYIRLSGFGRETGEAEYKGKKPTRIKRIGRLRESASNDLDHRTEDPMARNI